MIEYWKVEHRPHVDEYQDLSNHYSQAVVELEKMRKYIARLEAAYLDLEYHSVWDDTYIAGNTAKDHIELAKRKARENLEQIKAGDKP